ncbi:polysaccharide pyruvyl transferase family protein, partial [Bacillaceae bacterium Marseille-Q3522]|nr:polysaccharide pyruvyl transferase family protein [Bacillaceae bacterium Marseille-Q3522]
MTDKIVIIPGCSDLNRGDQALTWETKRLAEDCGLKGDFYLTTEKNEPVSQSIGYGLNIITPIIEHPSRAFSNKENIKYGKSLKTKWGTIALVDFITSLFYFNKLTRKLIKRFLKKEKRNSIEIMENATAFFMKGGGLIQSYGGVTSTYSAYFWVYHLLLAKALKKPIYVMPNSFGPFKGPLVKSIVRKALKGCTVVTSRETLSQKMVQEELNISIDNFPDLAFYLPNAKLDRKEIFEQFDLPLDRKLVAMTMRPHRFPNSKTPKQDYELFKNEIAKFIEWLYEKGYM